MLNTLGQFTKHYSSHKNYKCNAADHLALHMLETTLLSHVFCSGELSIRLKGLARKRSVEETHLDTCAGHLGSV